MKKQLFLIPVVGAFLLTGCEIKLGNTVIKLFEKESTEEAELPENFKAEFEGYKLARKVKDGGRYLLGVYRTREETMRFVNGDYHWGINSQTKQEDWFPYYFGTVGGTTKGAAEIEVKFVSDDEFTMQVFAEGQPWDEKYICVYNGSSSFGNDVMSIGLLDSPDATSYTDPKKKTTHENPCAKFKFFTSYEETVAYAPAAMFQFPNVDPEPVPKFIGTGHNADEDEEDYTSMDCKSYEIALDYEQYDLAHLYEKK